MSRSWLAVALLAVASLSTAGCASGDDTSSTQPIPPSSTTSTTPRSVTEPSTPASTATTQPTTTTPATTDTMAPTSVPPGSSSTDVSFIVVDDAGVTRAGRLIVSGPVAWADDDELGGIVYLPAGDGTTIQWLPAGAVQPIDTGLGHGLVGTTETGPAILTFHDSPAGEECGEIAGDGDVHAVHVRPLDASVGLGPPQLVACSHEGADDWYSAVAYRNGHLLRVHSYAAAWRYTDDEIVLTGPGGEQIELPAATFGGWIGWFEQQRELDAALSPDATLIAVRQRLDNRYSNGPDPDTGEIDVEEWERLTSAIPSTIRVVELATGTIRYETQAPYGVELGDFDGRHLVLVDAARSTIVDTCGESSPAVLPGIVVLSHPTADSPGTVLPIATPVTVGRGDTGPWVSHLQLRLLVHDPSADLAVDGRFGPATERAVRAFQRRHDLEPDGTVGQSTWTALLSTPGDQPSGYDGEFAILRAGGIATVDVGTPADEARTALTGLLGAPTLDVTIDPAERECVEGSDWAECVPVIAEARILTWDGLGLDVALTDHDPASPTVATALHVGGWRLRAGSGGTTGAVLTTTDGLGIGSLLRDVRSAHADVELYFNEGVYDTFVVHPDDRLVVHPDDRLVGQLGLTWNEQVRRVQTSLVAEGAEIAVDGEFGPATQAAWDAFVAAEGLTGQTWFPSITVLAALGVTFDDVPVTELWSTCTAAERPLDRWTSLLVTSTCVIL
jgi:peptidoglycan hydrolase-like protein with peptidoglycan-binding domain